MAAGGALLAAGLRQFDSAALGRAPRVGLGYPRVMRPVSRPWIIGSTLLFLALELLLAGLVPQLLEGRFVGHVMSLRIEALLMVTSFFVGGFIVGVISPGPRLVEPAIGAAVVVAAGFLIALFSPVAFLRWDPGRIALGSVVAFGLALYGAHLGEKLTGN